MEKKNMGAENEIDLLEIWFAVKKRLLVVLAVGLLFGAIASVYTKFMVDPTYVSTTKMLVLSKDTTLSKLADLQLSTQLSNDYEELIKSPPVLKQVVEDLELPMTYKTLGVKISVTKPEDTRILNVSVTDVDPERAAAIANDLAVVAGKYIAEVMEVTAPKIIAEGEVPTVRSGPNMKNNVMMGFLLGIVLAVIVIAVMTILNDTIKTEEDIEKYLGLANLASIPDRAHLTGGQKETQINGEGEENA